MRILVSLVMLFVAVGCGDPNTLRIPLIGKWCAKEMRSSDGKAKPVPPGNEIVVEFLKSGKFIGRIMSGKKKKKDEGTWKVKGKMLTTHINKRIESLAFKINGSTLILTRTKDKGSSVVFQRVSPTISKPPSPAAKPAVQQTKLTAHHQATRLFKEARGHYSKGQYALAAAKLEAAIRAEPSASALYSTLGLTYMAMGKCDLAIQYFRRYLRLRPNGKHAPRVRQEIQKLQSQLDGCPPPPRH